MTKNKTNHYCDCISFAVFRGNSSFTAYDKHFVTSREYYNYKMRITKQCNLYKIQINSLICKSLPGDGSSLFELNYQEMAHLYLS